MTSPHPPINFAKLPPIDPARFAKALALIARRTDHGRYVVQHHPDEGPLQSYNVDLVSEDVPRCDCGDHLWRDSLCKHILAALVAEGSPVTAEAMAAHFSRFYVKPTVPSPP